MTFLRNVVHDLIQKRLWPIAIALVAAVIAVPILLGGGSSAGTTPAVTAAVPTGPNGLANHRDAARAEVVSLDEQASGPVDRAGKTRDPFVQHHQPKPVNLNAAVTTAVKAVSNAVSSLSGKSTSNSTSVSTPVASTPSTGGTPPKATTPKPTGAADDTYHVTLAFGEAGAQKTYSNVARLTPLPSSTNPFFVFLGLKTDGKSAVFLVDAGAVPSGDGTCEPSPDDCEQVVLKAGDVEFFELQSGTAGVVQYQLDLKSITKSKAATTASAALAHARESRAGREYIRELVADDPSALSDWDFSSHLGLLVAKAPAVANVPQAVSEAADGQAPVDTSTVMTVPADPAPQP